MHTHTLNAIARAIADPSRAMWDVEGRIEEPCPFDEARFEVEEVEEARDELAWIA